MFLEDYNSDNGLEISEEFYTAATKEFKDGPGMAIDINDIS